MDDLDDLLSPADVTVTFPSDVWEAVTAALAASPVQSPLLARVRADLQTATERASGRIRTLTVPGDEAERMTLEPGQG